MPSARLLLRPARHALAGAAASAARPAPAPLRLACCCAVQPRAFATSRPAAASDAKSSSSSPSSFHADDVNQSGPIDPPTPDELQLGELPGGTFRIEPLRRVGEDTVTMRARLLYQSRKRGTLESDLLLSTFAAAHLATMPPALLAQYDRFLDENDWDIYYWATQGGPEEEAQAAAAAAAPVERPAHEWAQTVGTFKPAYRPVPARWQGSEILALLRQHVRERSAGGATDDGAGAGAGAGADTKAKGTGMAFMPPLPDLGSRKD